MCPISWMKTLFNSSVLSMELVWRIILFELDSPREMLLWLRTSILSKFSVCHVGSVMMVFCNCFFMYESRRLSVRLVVKLFAEKCPFQGNCLLMDLVIRGGAECVCGGRTDWYRAKSDRSIVQKHIKGAGCVFVLVHYVFTTYN